MLFGKRSRVSVLIASNFYATLDEIVVVASDGIDIVRLARLPSGVWQSKT
jgi:hypothetical protein